MLKYHKRGQKRGLRIRNTNSEMVNEVNGISDYVKYE